MNSISYPSTTTTREYPTGLDHVKTLWKRSMRNPENCPSCYIINQDNNQVPLSTISINIGTDKSLLQQQQRCNEEIIYAVQNGRNMVKEMMGIIQLKKYRTMNQRYGGQSMAMTDSAKNENLTSTTTNNSDVEQEMHQAMMRLEEQKADR